ncbi:hypothetical protein CgunFtcFv8_023027 [Champsocephalus gunnari]|uniref:MACPF domain-containing protein n=1 Tax=Champsocephalus gunnari TaxID=52237 RepID=A0AAN8HPB5_CHAGU|nr:hypothetical protein CgunFtcFv8_023027 [Champsocephalus gunnari]
MFTLHQSFTVVGQDCSEEKSQNNGCFGMCPAVSASRTPWTTADESLAVARSARAVNKPNPINCKLGRWSSWTPCNSCTEERIRFRHIEKPSQFGGTECFETLWEKLACPTVTTQCMLTDYCGESFTCNETGRCISQSLRCNGEMDCEDFSDEDNCEEMKLRDDKCSTFLPIPRAERGTQGYNSLTGGFVDHNLYYNEDEKNYRKPYNYHTYHFVAQAMSEGSHEYYEDMTSVLAARKTMNSFNAGFTVGVYYVEAGPTASLEYEFLKNITQHKSQDLGFVRLFSKVQTAHFKMRSNELMLHEDFYISLMELPEQYDFGMYFRFFSTFGTHYVTEGTMGGTLEYIVVVNKTSMASSNMEGKQVGRCFGGSIGVSYPIDGSSSVDFKVGGKGCIKKGEVNIEKEADSAIIEDIVTLVKGGHTDSSGGLLAIRDPETYRNWGASLKYNPTLIDYETLPIYELVRRSTAAEHSGTRLANLERGLDEYLQQFDSCRCAPCRHNGIPVLRGTSCVCICKSGYQGEACEETLRGDTSTDGSWSCWGAWTACASGRKTRTKTCDNPAPDGGGATCRGSSFQTRHC